MLIQEYQLYLQICFLYIYGGQKCTAAPQLLLHNFNQIKVDSNFNMRAEASSFQRFVNSKNPTEDFSSKGNEEQYHYYANNVVHSYPNLTGHVTENSNNKEITNYTEILSKLLPVKRELSSNGNKQPLTSSIMEWDNENIFNTEIEYINDEELLSLFNFYIDEAMSSHRSPKSSVLGSISNAPLHEYRFTFPSNQHQPKTNELTNTFTSGNIPALEIIDSISSPSMLSLNNENILEHENVDEFLYKNSYNPSQRLQWMELANNYSVPFLKSNLYEVSGREIKPFTELNKENKIGDALLNLIKDIEDKTGLKVERNINGNHIEIKILGTPQRKIRFRKGRKRIKPFQRSPLIRENLYHQKISSQNDEPKLWKYLDSFESFESKKTNSNEENNQLQESGVQENKIESQRPKLPRYPKSIIKDPDAYHFNPRHSPVKETKTEDITPHNKFNNGNKFPLNQKIQGLPYKKFRKVPRLEFPFPKSFLSGIHFLIKGYEDLGPHIIIKSGQQN